NGREQGVRHLGTAFTALDIDGVQGILNAVGLDIPDTHGIIVYKSKLRYPFLCLYGKQRQKETTHQRQPAITYGRCTFQFAWFFHVYALGQSEHSAFHPAPSSESKKDPSKKQTGYFFGCVFFCASFCASCICSRRSCHLVLTLGLLLFSCSLARILSWSII